jgi:ATP-dependent Lhr-like helicase
VLPAIVGQFEGYPAAASAWDSDLLQRASRTIRRAGSMTCAAAANWCGRLSARQKQRHGVAQYADGAAAAQSGRLWSALTEQTPVSELSPKTQKVHDALSEHGALFFDELIHEAHLLPSELEIACRNWWAPAW